MSWTASQRDRGPSSDGVAAAADELEEPAHLGLELQRRDLLAVEEAAQFIGRVACPREPALRRGRAGDAERRQPRELVLLVLPAGVAEMAQRRVSSEARRVGKECGSTFVSRWAQTHTKKTKEKHSQRVRI